MRLTKTLRDAFVRQVMDDVPKIDYSEQQTKLVTEFAVKRMPPKVRAVYDNPDTRGWIETDRSWISACSSYIGHPGNGAELNLTDDENAQLRAVRDAAKAQDDKLHVLRIKLRSVANACSTDKALRAALPEFDKYIPKDEDAVCRTLPAVANVVADFVKAGWPKGEQREQSATD